MHPAVDGIANSSLKAKLPEFKPGMTVRVGQKIQEGEKSRIQYFEGLIIACHMKGNINSTITVRKVVDGIGVEKVFPIHSPLLSEIEILKAAEVRRSKLYYLRGLSGKAVRLKSIAVKAQKTVEVPVAVSEPVPAPAA